MSFWVKQIKIWSIHKTVKPKVYNFEQNKVNVITGDSTTGKTSILAIIDYCLGAEKNNIPDGIFEYSSYFGITVVINDNVISVTRESPSDNQVKEELYIDYTVLTDSPTSGKKITLNKFIDLLNEELFISSELLKKISKEQKGGKMRASFRSFLIFNSLTENIIGDKFDYLDYKFYEGNLSNVIKTLFKYSIVEDSSSFAEIENKIEKIEAIERKRDKIDNDNNKIVNQLNELILELSDSNIIQEEHNVFNINESLDYIDEIVNYDDLEMTKDNSIEKLNHLKERKNEVLINLSIFKNYKNEIEKYNNSLDQNIKSLAPLTYLKEKLYENVIISPETYLFLDELEKSLNTVKKTKKSLTEIEDFEVEVNLLENELKLINKEIILTKENLDSTINLKKIYVKGTIKEKVNALKVKYKINNKPFDSNKGLSFEVSNMKLLDAITIDDYNNISSNEIQRNRNKLLIFKEIFQQNLVRVYLQIEEIIKEIPSLSNYHRHKVTFNLDRMIISLIAPKNEFSFPISNIGSKSNYMYLHLAFFLGIHSFLNTFEKSLVSQFLFIDQPSIPYFSDANNSKDKTKLVEAFKLLDNFLKRNTKQEKMFQIILVEHASKDLWESNDLTSFHLVEEFTNGKGLLPQNFFN